MWLDWVTNDQWGKRGPKLRSAGENLLQKYARELGEVAEIEILSENHLARKW